jgi:FtsZ-interacting cell division protein ZipA
MDIRWVLIIGGVIRLFGALMFHFWKIRPEAETGN